MIREGCSSHPFDPIQAPAEQDDSMQNQDPPTPQVTSSQHPGSFSLFHFFAKGIRHHQPPSFHFTVSPAPAMAMLGALPPRPPPAPGGPPMPRELPPAGQRRLPDGRRPDHLWSVPNSALVKERQPCQFGKDRCICSEMQPVPTIQPKLLQHPSGFFPMPSFAFVLDPAMPSPFAPRCCTGARTRRRRAAAAMPRRCSGARAGRCPAGRSWRSPSSRCALNRLGRVQFRGSC